MTKNITVTDENGKIIGSTYPKRAKGLVKSGRARWADENKICLLACPFIEEDTNMETNIYNIVDNQLSKMQEDLKNKDFKEAIPVKTGILKLLSKLADDSRKNEAIELVKEQIKFLTNSMTEEIPKMNMDSEFQPSAVQNIIMCRETTKQKIIILSEKLLDLTFDETSYSKDGEFLNVPSDNAQQVQDLGTKICEKINNEINRQIADNA